MSNTAKRKYPRSRGAKSAASTLSAAVLAGGAFFIAPAAAFAADPFPANALYGTSSSLDIYQIDEASGHATAVLQLPASARGAVNQLGVVAGGDKLVAATPSQVFVYSASSEEWTEISRPAGSATAGTMGGVDLSTGQYFYGGQSANGAFEYSAVDLTANTVSASVLRVTLPQASGANGDVAFDARGNMYIVAGGTTSRIYRVSADQVAAGGTQTATPIGGTISLANINSIAFGSDGYLYVQSSGTLMKVNPSNGQSASTSRISGDVTSLTDLGSWASPSTVSVGIELPDGRVNDGDDFNVVLAGDGIDTGNTGGTEGNDSVEVGPILGLPGQEYTATQTGTGDTNLDTYTTTWQCINTADGNKVISSGEGNEATFTMPEGAVAGAIDCKFTNIPKAKPTADNDEKLGNPAGSTVTVPVLSNDTEGLLPGTVNLLDPNDKPVKELVVKGEGTWNVNDDGTVTFTPEKGFTGNPTPVKYTAEDKDGQSTGATITVTYLDAPKADNDAPMPETPAPTTPVASPSAATSTPEATGHLANTGVQRLTMAAAVAGMAMLAAGAVAIVVTRRRRQH